jgi:hypothetical protein
VLHVRLHADFAYADIALEARIFQFAGEHGIDFMGDFFAYAFVSMGIHGSCSFVFRFQQ